MAKIFRSTYGLFIKKWKSTMETILTAHKKCFLQNIYLPNFTLYAIILFVLLLLQKFCLSCLWWGLMMSLSNRKRPWNVRPGMIDWRHQLTDFSRKTHRIVSNCLGGILMFCQLSNPDGLVSQTKVKWKKFLCSTGRLISKAAQVKISFLNVSQAPSTPISASASK